MRALKIPLPSQSNENRGLLLFWMQLINTHRIRATTSTTGSLPLGMMMQPKHYLERPNPNMKNGLSLKI
jgi:hypothetical protein